MLSKWQMHQSVNLKQTCTSGAWRESLISGAFKANVTLPSLWDIIDNVHCTFNSGQRRDANKNGNHLWEKIYLWGEMVPIKWEDSFIDRDIKIQQLAQDKNITQIFFFSSQPTVMVKVHKGTFSKQLLWLFYSLSLEFCWKKRLIVCCPIGSLQCKCQLSEGGSKMWRSVADAQSQLVPHDSEWHHLFSWTTRCLIHFRAWSWLTLKKEEKDKKTKKTTTLCTVLHPLNLNRGRGE